MVINFPVLKIFTGRAIIRFVRLGSIPLIFAIAVSAQSAETPQPVERILKVPVRIKDAYGKRIGDGLSGKRGKSALTRLISTYFLRASRTAQTAAVSDFARPLFMAAA